MAILKDTNIIGTLTADEIQLGGGAIKDIIVERSSNYILYKSGFLIQWGRHKATGKEATTNTISLYKPFANTNYHVFGVYEESSNNQYGQCWGRTTTAFIMKVWGGNSVSWLAFGMKG